MSEYVKLVRITPDPKGVHDPSIKYNPNCLVMSPSGATAYLSVKEVPAGTELTNDEYWIVHTDVSEALDTLTEAVKSAQTAVSKVNAAADADELYRLSNGHFRHITFDTDHVMDTWQNTGTATAPNISKRGTRAGSDFIACPKRLFLHFTSTNARIYLYFYKLVDGIYTPNWDILGAGTKTSSNILNYVGQPTIPALALDLPDGTYMQVSVDTSVAGDVLLYGWDGVKFGAAVSGVAVMTTSGGEVGSLAPAGNGGVMFPGNAKAAICTSGKGALLYVAGVLNGDIFPLGGSIDGAVSFFYEFPGGYDYYIARYSPECTIKWATKTVNGVPKWTTAITNEKITVFGDLSDHVLVISESSAQKPSARALDVIERAKAICSVQWKAAKPLYVDATSAEKAKFTYREGVTYNGFPYGGEWDQANFIGWHVSPHTFVNAANDPDSIFYNGRTISSEEGAVYSQPYYALVCSTFACLACGWPYPTTNAGFIYDPKVDIVRTHTPPIGAVWSDIFSHCVVPERVDFYPDCCAVSVYEQARPNGLRTTRLSNVTKDEDKDGLTLINGADYYDAYVIAAYHRDANGIPAVEAPFFDLSDLTIVNGSARPYKGDKSVYTSEEDVLINIKNASAEQLYVYRENESQPFAAIAIEGRAQIDIRSSLGDSGSGTIYHVCTDADDTKESFEYVDVSRHKVLWKAAGTQLSFKNTAGGNADFWYAEVYFTGNEILKHKYESDKPRTGMSVLCRSDNDYSAWFKDGAVIDVKANKPVEAVFRKGRYGAYTVPLVKA